MHQLRQLLLKLLSAPGILKIGMSNLVTMTVFVSAQCQKSFESLLTLHNFSVSRCTSFPDPPIASKMERASHVNNTFVSLGTSLTYTCLDNHYFAGQDIPINRTIYLTCSTSDGIIHAPAVWPNCIEGRATRQRFSSSM